MHNVYSYPELSRTQQSYSLFDHNIRPSPKSVPIQSPLDGWAGEGWSSNGSSSLSSGNSRSRASTFPTNGQSMMMGMGMNTFGNTAQRAFSDMTTSTSSSSPMESVAGSFGPPQPYQHNDGPRMPMEPMPQDPQDPFNMDQIGMLLFPGRSRSLFHDSCICCSACST
jgi:hypothetical protein